MSAFRDITGIKSGRLTVIALSGKNKWGAYLWKCKCGCGEEIITRGASIVNGDTKSCGCLQREHITKLGKMDKTGRIPTATHKANIGLGLLNFNQENPEARKTKSAKMVGRKYSAERRKKISDGLKGNKLSVKHRAKISNGLKGKKHSLETRNKRSATLKRVNGGHLHHNWKGGIDRGEQKRHRETVEYRYWRDSIYQRDNYTCQECGKRSVKLNAHHIKSFTKYPKMRHDITNGISLCIECHYGIYHNGRI